MLKRAYFIGAYGASWLLFGLGALALNLLGFALFVLCGPERSRPMMRKAIRKTLSGWIGWVTAAGLVRVNLRGLDDPSMPRPAVCVANHPGLLDAVFLLSRLPDAVVIFKRAMLRNPFLAPVAIMAGYSWGDRGTDFVREAIRQIASGCTLLIFPEGTRTAAGAVLNPVKPGFALIAGRAGVPVQVIVIRSSRDLLPRGRAWWHVPQFPATVDISADVCLPVDPCKARAAAAAVETRLRSCLT